MTISLQTQNQKTMESMTITITRADLCDRIFAATAYTARAREAMGTPPAITERILATADDNAMLYPLIENSVNEVHSDIVRYHPGSTAEFDEDESGGHYIFNIRLPANYPTGNGRKLQQSIGSNIADRVLQEWYASVKPDEVAMTAARIQNDTMTLQALLTQRTKPSKQNDRL